MSVLFARCWVVLAALLIAAGWTLSLAGALDRTGYAIALAVIALAVWRCAFGTEKRRSLRLPRRRFLRWLPLGFALIAALAILGGLLHAPNNFDALSYRIPRTLHWLAEGHWHWIDTNYARANVRAQGSEWMMAPLLLFTHTDRAVWLLNALPFLALPGLIFSVFVRAGVSPRVAWRWMWLLPCAYGLAGQVGGSANDLPGAFFALAAVDFALRARRSGRVQELWLSMLAAAVMTSIKLSNAPLGLVWLVAAWPTLRLLLRRPVASACVACLAMIASFLPSVVLNVKHCGDWTGAALELPETRQPRPPGLVFAANTMNLVVMNFAPPVFPWARRWNEWAAGALPARFLEPIHRVYGAHYSPTDVPELQGEDWAGLGFGLSVLLAASAVATGRRRAVAVRGDRLLCGAPWLALGVLAWMIPVTSVPRMAVPYYPLIVLAIVAGRKQRELEASRWWNGLAALAVATCGLQLVLTPSRPLLPMVSMISSLRSADSSGAAERAARVYETYARRADALASVRALLPVGVSRFGLVTQNDLETSLWRPFGSRTFEHVVGGTDRERLVKRGLDHLVINASLVGPALDPWLVKLGAERIGEVEIRTLASGGAERWIVARLRLLAEERQP